MNLLKSATLASLMLFPALPALAGHDEYRASPPPHPHAVRDFDRRADDPAAKMLQHVAHAVRRLELEETQRDAIRGIIRGAGEELRAMHPDAMALRDSVHDIVTAEDFDAAALAAAAQAGGELMAERIVIAGTAANAALSQLTPEQRAKLEALRAEFRERKRGHRPGAPGTDA